MLIGVLSDTHSDLDITVQAVELLSQCGAEALIHCGDLYGPEVVRICSQLPFWFVFGNHDADTVPELIHASNQYGATCLGWGGVCHIGQRKFGVVHGHLTMDLERVISLGPELIFCGHSHMPGEVVRANVRRINPGALYRADSCTVAIFDSTADTVFWKTVTPSAEFPGHRSSVK